MFTNLSNISATVRTINTTVFKNSQCLVGAMQNNLLCKHYASSLSKTESGITRAIFNFMDRDKNGCLTPNDLRVGLSELVNLFWHDGNLNYIVKTAAEKSGKDCFDYDAMMKYLYKAGKLSTDRLVAHSFDLVDTNNDGKISKEELRNSSLVKSIEEHLKINVVDDIFNIADTDQNGYIDRDEFKKIFHSNLHKYFEQS